MQSLVGQDERGGRGRRTRDKTREGGGGRHGNEGKACAMTPAVRSISSLHLFKFGAAPASPAVCDVDGALLVFRSARPSFLMILRLPSLAR